MAELEKSIPSGFNSSASCCTQATCITVICSDPLYCCSKTNDGIGVGCCSPKKGTQDITNNNTTPVNGHSNSSIGEVGFGLIGGGIVLLLVLLAIQVVFCAHKVALKRARRERRVLSATIPRLPHRLRSRQLQTENYGGGQLRGLPTHRTSVGSSVPFFRPPPVYSPRQISSSLSPGANEIPETPPAYSEEHIYETLPESSGLPLSDLSHEENGTAPPSRTRETSISARTPPPYVEQLSATQAQYQPPSYQSVLDMTFANPGGEPIQLYPATQPPDAT